jgi:hypothetical protein
VTLFLDSLRAAPAALDGFAIGDRVMVVARSDWCAVIDGWRGAVAGFDQGMVVIKVHDEGIDKTFYVPAGELVLDLGVRR